MTAHRIAEVRFQQAADQGRPSSEAPLLCTCGEDMRSADWEAHRGRTQTQLRVARNHQEFNARRGTK